MRIEDAVHFLPCTCFLCARYNAPAIPATTARPPSTSVVVPPGTDAAKFEREDEVLPPLPPPLPLLPPPDAPEYVGSEPPAPKSCVGGPPESSPVMRFWGSPLSPSSPESPPTAPPRSVPSCPRPRRRCLSKLRSSLMGFSLGFRFSEKSRTPEQTLPPQKLCR